MQVWLDKENGIAYLREDEHKPFTEYYECDTAKGDLKPGDTLYTLVLTVEHYDSGGSHGEHDVNLALCNDPEAIFELKLKVNEMLFGDLLRENDGYRHPEDDDRRVDFLDTSVYLGEFMQWGTSAKSSRIVLYHVI